MTILVTSGFQKSWCDFAQNRMRSMGVMDPAIAERSKLGPHDFNDKLDSIHKLSASDHESIEQRDPGKAWQLIAADLVIANAEKSPWGWADPRNIHFLDFWCDLDPTCRFILIYGSPAQSLAQSLKSGSCLASDVKHHLRRWSQYHDALLRFYQHNHDKSILVNINSFEGTATGAAECLDNRFGMPAHLLNTSEKLDKSAILEVVAADLVITHEFDSTLLMELENSADVPSTSEQEPNLITLDAHSEFLHTRAEILASEQRSLEINDLREMLRKSSNQLKLANEDLSLAQRDLSQAMEAKRLEAAARKSETECLRKDIERLHIRLIEAQSAVERSSQIESTFKEERELLTRQLKQVQEELELYFAKYNDLKHRDGTKQEEPHTPSRNGELCAAAPESSILLDLRQYIEGSGWHSPEEFGRWAGTGLTSTIMVPPIQPGRYQLDIKIVDAMSVDISKGLEVKFNGRALSTSATILSNLSGVLAPIRRARATIRNIEKPYPMKIKATVPAEMINSSKGEHALAITAPKRISPSQFGQPDTRELSVCVESIKLTRID